MSAEASSGDRSPTDNDAPTAFREGATLFGYTHVTGIPPCPCNDPGTYLAAIQGPELLDVELQCWCGARIRVQFDDEAERAQFIAQRGIPSSDPGPDADGGDVPGLELFGSTRD